MPRRTILALVAIATGVALELAVQMAGGRREAWDSPIYWTVGIPAAAVVAAVIGYVASGKEWLSTALIVPSQVFTMMVRSGELGSLWPLAVALSAILSAPFIAAAFVTSRLARHRAGG
jgi:hypothetical protein